MRWQAAALLLLPLCASAWLVPAVSRAQDPKLVEVGKEVYGTYCIICHGNQGDGKGLMGIISRAQTNGLVIQTYPRDFTAGLFKFRSTATGYLPTDDDLLRTVTQGVSRSGMPSHTELSLEERKAVIEYIKTFSKRWQEEERGTPLEFPKPPKYVGSSESIARGKTIYKDYGCFNCHGETGRGDGPSSDVLQDNWGDKILAFDFSSGPLKGGAGAKEVYRTFVTGLDGTPMPSYEESLAEQQRWDLVSYCLELMR